MQAKRMSWGWVLRLDAGEEVVSTLAGWAEREHVKSGQVTGLGAVGETELGFFVRETKSYVHHVFRGEHELGSLTGNISVLDGRPFPHLHALIAGEDFVGYTGHLFRGVVTVTCEIHVVTDGSLVKRDLRPDLGYNPLALD